MVEVIVVVLVSVVVAAVVAVVGGRVKEIRTIMMGKNTKRLNLHR